MVVDLFLETLMLATPVKHIFPQVQLQVTLMPAAAMVA